MFRISFWFIFSLFLFAYVRVCVHRCVRVYVPPPCPIQRWRISYTVLPLTLFFALQCAMEIALYQGIHTFCIHIFPLSLKYCG